MRTVAQRRLGLKIQAYFSSLLAVLWAVTLAYEWWVPVWLRVLALLASITHVVLAIREYRKLGRAGTPTGS